MPDAGETDWKEAARRERVQPRLPPALPRAVLLRPEETKFATLALALWHTAEELKPAGTEADLEPLRQTLLKARSAPAKSGGEQMLLGRMALLFLLRGMDGGLLLLDEPETHFNDVWKREIVDLVDDNVLKETRAQVVVATHTSIALTDVFNEEVTLLQRVASLNQTFGLRSRWPDELPHPIELLRDDIAEAGRCRAEMRIARDEAGLEFTIGSGRNKVAQRAGRDPFALVGASDRAFAAEDPGERAEQLRFFQG